MRRIVPIVEGHSEAAAIPAFIRRILHDAGAFDVEPDAKPIREKRQRLANPDVFARRVRMARMKPGCIAVLALMDADDDAACQLGPELVRAGRSTARVPVAVNLAVREIEAWLLAGIESLRGFRGVLADAERPHDVESIRGAKERLEQLKPNGYKPTIDVLPMLLRLDYQSARTRSRSLDRFVRLVTQLAQAE